MNRSEQTSDIDGITEDIDNLMSQSNTNQAVTKRKASRENTEDSANPNKRVNTRRIPIHLESIFRKIRNLDDKLLRFELHNEYLIKYAENKIIPKGLKINVRPSFGREDPAFMNIWTNTVAECSLKLLELTLGQLNNLIETTKIKRVSADSSLTSTASISDALETRKFLSELKERRQTNLRKLKSDKLDKILNPGVTTSEPQSKKFIKKNRRQRPRRPNSDNKKSTAPRWQAALTTFLETLTTDKS